ncbi:hypothetical protein F5Y13DRAFT_144382 [Hypoxylon sp. FL1857]|nr:hypothetical protein F5Y13DRAFT_144382 [Hypoxylon sp. FL1857]
MKLATRLLLQTARFGSNESDIIALSFRQRSLSTKATAVTTPPQRRPIGTYGIVPWMYMTSIMYNSSAVWGEDAGEFQARRFFQESGKLGKYDPVAFRGFGGGTTLCSGRHFAATEMLAFVSCIIRFDARPLSEKWGAPTIERANKDTIIASLITTLKSSLILILLRTSSRHFGM